MKKEHCVIISTKDNSLAFENQFNDFNSAESRMLAPTCSCTKEIFAKKVYLLCVVFLMLFLMTNLRTVAQSNTLVIESEHLSNVRNVSIAKSQGFDSTQPYQLFVILDEPVLFDYTVSVLNYLSIWKEIPQYVAIGIPNEDRWNELQPKKGESIDDTPFYKFMQNEIESIPHVKNASFRTLIGHSLSARFALQFFFRNNEYSGVIGVSPPLIPILQEEFCNYRANQQEDRNSYVYMCSSDQDLRFHKKFFLETQKKFNPKKNPNVMMEYFKKQVNTSHSLMPVTAIQNGLIFVLDDFFNLPSKGIEKFSKKKSVPDSLLEHSYERIHDIYGVTPEFRSVDFQSFVDLYIAKSNFSEAHRLCDLYIELTKKGEVYDLIDAYYLKGLTFEEEKDYTSALTFYRKGFSIIPEEVLNKDDFEEDIIRLEKLLSKSKKNRSKE
jgi:tetratricopeptide (TPR) repeat protein